MNWLLAAVGLYTISDLSTAESRGRASAVSEFEKQHAEDSAEIVRLRGDVQALQERAVKAEKRIVEQAEAEVVVAALKVVQAILAGQPMDAIGALRQQLAIAQSNLGAQRQMYGMASGSIFGSGLLGGLVGIR